MRVSGLCAIRHREHHLRVLISLRPDEQIFIIMMVFLPNVTKQISCIAVVPQKLELHAFAVFR